MTPAVPLGEIPEEAAAGLTPVLEEAQRRGFLGPGPVNAHIRHAWPLVEALPANGVAVDLGSGGGVPGLILAAARPGLRWIFVESQERRSAWLREAVRRAELGNVEVRWERVEATGRSEIRGTAEVVTSRSFGPPAVTAECGAPLLGPDGVLWVAEPPDTRPDRWPLEGLAELGLVPGTALVVPGWMGLQAVSPCPDRYPRRVGIPAKRPLF